MGVITLKIDDELERKLRAKAGRVHGATKGTISASVEEALKAWLGETEPEEIRQEVYTAKKGGISVAEAPTLKELAQKLRAANTDPRDVLVESLPQPPKTIRMGLRTKG